MSTSPKSRHSFGALGFSSRRLTLCRPSRSRPDRIESIAKSRADVGADDTGAVPLASDARDAASSDAVGVPLVLGTRFTALVVGGGGGGGGGVAAGGRAGSDGGGVSVDAADAADATSDCCSTPSSSCTSAASAAAAAASSFGSSVAPVLCVDTVSYTHLTLPTIA
eukprot:TRINITY_DN632_c0_g5_i3.p1 TRINITY_DN632_c0_g5~~TRINITY_DN632_c0_g5_i3.p1  ORF type:complete len:166 (-),score=45.03 TRINITY_DN632_c0_g5_i3:28-525(-)